MYCTHLHTVRTNVVTKYCVNPRKGGKVHKNKILPRRKKEDNPERLLRYRLRYANFAKPQKGFLVFII